MDATQWLVLRVQMYITGLSNKTKNKNKNLNIKPKRTFKITQRSAY